MVEPKFHRIPRPPDPESHRRRLLAISPSPALLGAQQLRLGHRASGGSRTSRLQGETCIIFCFMEGAMSQMDTFEYKPRLQRDDQRTVAGPRNA